jgi:serine/threonine-protein kinase
MKKVVGIFVMLGVLMSALGTAQAQYYGAIAYSESTGNWGTANDYGSRGQAERAALSRCKSSDCEIKCWFRNSCGALAKGEGGLGWSWAADSREEAEAQAIANCEEHGTDCRTICWVCTAR